MSTFPKKNLYFQLKHTNLDFFAQLNANQQNNLLNFNTQLNNIRVKPLNLKKNLNISNIFNKEKVSIKINNKNLLINNLFVLFLLKTLTKRKDLSSFIKAYFEISKETLNILSNSYLNNAIFPFYTLKKNEIYLNSFILTKINEICFYQYHNTVLNNQKVLTINLKDISFTNFWINLSVLNIVKKKALQNKIIYNFLVNRNLNNNSMQIAFANTSLNLNTTVNVIIKETSNYFLYKPFNDYLNIPKNYLYVLLRLEEKIYDLNKNQDKINSKKLLNFYNFLIELLVQRKDKIITTNFLLGNIDYITKIKNIGLDYFISKTIKNLTKSTKQNIQAEKFFNLIKNKLTKKIISKQNFNTAKLNNYQPSFRLKISKSFNDKKLELTTQYAKSSYNKKIIKTLLQQNTKIFYINALALTKFGFLLEKKNSGNQNFATNPNKFLANLDREMISKYKYIGVYIKDLIRVAFIALFLKKPAFLAKFIAFQLNVLPKNRKETTFIRFIIKLVKTFAAEREEIWGLRLKFKGRVNRWRRTKVILGQRGILPLHTMNNRIEYGSAQGVNRKGAVGVHIWIWYNPIFKNLLKTTYNKYFIYSKYLNYKKQIND